MKKFENIIQVTNYFSDENVCREHLEKLRWTDGQPVCPFCGSKKVYRIENGKRYKCANNECYKKFSVTVGTIFENTKIPLRVWFIAIYLACNHKKGISSLQLSRDLGITQKTAWFVLHRIREMLKDKAPEMLANEVEVDEAYIGGKDYNRHRSKKRGGTGSVNKIPIVGLVERGGNVIVKKMSDTTSWTLQEVVLENVKQGSCLYTDEFRAYVGLRDVYTHGVIKHATKEYVRKQVHTNTIEGFWSLLKRGIIGIYHFTSEKHLQRYCDEFSYRYNTRGFTQEKRLNDAIKNSDGVRLKYKELTA